MNNMDTDLNNKTMKQLKLICKNNKYKGYSKFKKMDLIQFILSKKKNADINDYINNVDDFMLIHKNLDNDILLNLFKMLNLTSKSRKHKNRRIAIRWEIVHFIYKVGFKQMLENGENLLEWALGNMNIEKWYPKPKKRSIKPPTKKRSIKPPTKKRSIKPPTNKREKLFSIHIQPDLQALWKIDETSLDKSLEKKFGEGILRNGL